MTKVERRAPGPRGHFLLGMLPAIRKDPLQMLQQAAAEFGDVVRMRFGAVTAHMISHPDGVQRVLVENSRNYGKQTRGFLKLREILGDGLLTAEGETWRRHRRMAQPAFHRQRLASFGDTMAREAERTAERWKEMGARGEVVDVAQEMARLTLQIIGRTMLTRDVALEADRVGSALTYLLHAANRRTSRVIDLPQGIPTPGNRRFAAALRALDGVVNQIIAERRGAAQRPEDLLTLLLETRDEETGEPMTDRELRDEAMTIFLAGHETTANALTWSFYLLSRNPSLGRTLRDELERELRGNPSLADLPRLKLTRAVIEEALRLYPPAWLISRSVTEDDEIGGFHIPARSIVFVCPFIVHRDARVWENPEGFDPDRFQPERAASIPRGAYFPFGAGPRQCIGASFASMEAQLVLATLWRRFRLDLVPGRPIEPEPSITLRPRHGMPMTVHPWTGRPG
jgi:cytochrome P450